jgi:hypothetical protein
VQPRVFDIRRNARVDDLHPRPCVRGEDVHGCAAIEEVARHLRRHVARIGAHALGSDSVIRRRDDDRLGGRCRRRVAQHTCRPDVQFLQPAERADRLRQPRLQCPRFCARVLVGRADRRDRRFDSR